MEVDLRVGFAGQIFLVGGDAVDSDIEEILDGISRLREDLNAKMNALIITENRLAGSMIILQESIDIVEEKLEGVTQHFLAANSPPLWKMLQRSKDSVSVQQEAVRVWKSQKEDFENFVDQYA